MNQLYTPCLCKIKTLSNLHVGNGEVNYSVLDKQVQRDILTNFPTINATSLKGALRDFTNYSYDDINLANAVANTIFGSDPTQNADTNDKEDEKSSINKQGYVNFFDAKLLSLPARSDKKPFFRATSKEVLTLFKEYCESFGIACDLEVESITPDTGGDVSIEEFDTKYALQTKNRQLKDLIGEDCIVLEDEDFRVLAKELPFVARNYLENGKSENLWYEEIVPRESIFYFVLQFPSESLLASQENRAINLNRKKPDNEKLKGHFSKFQDLLNDTKLFIGANTTVGYGYCEIKNFFCKKENT